MCKAEGMDRFYLNHVGYKVDTERRNWTELYQFYLNHVGYKVWKPTPAKNA